MKKIQLLFVTALTMGVLLAPGPVTARDQIQDLNRAVIRIEGLSCGGCFSTINAGLETLEGFSGMGANLFRKLIAVDFTAPLTKEAISEKLSEVGYPGEIKSVDKITPKESFAYIESRRTGFNGSGSCCGGQSPGAARGQGRIAPSGGSCCTVPGGNGQIPDQSL